MGYLIRMDAMFYISISNCIFISKNNFQNNNYAINLNCFPKCYLSIKNSEFQHQNGALYLTYQNIHEVSYLHQNLYQYLRFG